ncbi:hypothetical protein DTO195F2_3402 [Paecilomyces variotii]|nr:hypothetical protein DTO195F2_3402 [Paecilomyces variotii]KAJ9306964.1 hypothetical protein DTO217A2_3554 [Paecilomyces variotii]KAJ9373248.1 hypothetical protein DTO282E5_1984 [Paecilomyces variotii]
MGSSSASPFQLENIVDGETVHQRCVLLIGQCPSRDGEKAGYSEIESISISTADGLGSRSFPVQSWPIAQGRFKALVILSPGPNQLTVEHYREGQVQGTIQLNITYVPLLQLPPLHLAIMIAKDSPLLIDCPHSKNRGISTAHGDLNAAIAKFRMTAYMWQALTAEDMRSKGLGRRSFRLEEEWSTDTLSRDFLNAAYHEPSLYDEDGCNGARSTAKIYLVRSEKTVKELRDAQVAQQNLAARRKDDLHVYFKEALIAHGSPFLPSQHPVVAGLILDSTFSSQMDLILGHAALGSCDPNGISLGIFGSHLTYSWPRFLEEVPACLLDTTPADGTVGNDNGECETAWEACAVGQGAFLHEVGHAFGAPHTTGIMARGYAHDWPKNFLPHTAFCTHTNSDGELVVDSENYARWDIADALSFRLKPHFRLPGDTPLSSNDKTSKPAFEVLDHEGIPSKISIKHRVGVACVQFNGVSEPVPSITQPLQNVEHSIAELEKRFGKDTPLQVKILGMNGQYTTIGNVWRLISGNTIHIPGSSILLWKHSIMSEVLEKQADDALGWWEWAVLLHQVKDGKLSRAVAVDMRVGAIIDGAVVYYDNGEKVPCGPRVTRDQVPIQFGGHLSRKIDIPEGVEITKVEITRSSWALSGIRIHLSDGTVDGAIEDYDDQEVLTLEPWSGHKIIGFFGRSEWMAGNCCPVHEFGIITAPSDAELPMTVYTMPELQNTDGGVSCVSMVKKSDTCGNRSVKRKFRGDDDF